MKSLCLFIAICLSSCNLIGSNNNSSSHTESVELGYSFGECIGFCKAELLVDQSQQTLTTSTWIADGEVKVATAFLPPSTWQDILHSIDLENFCAMEDSYGCPDCADGGAEWVTIKCDDEAKEVIFEYGSELAELKDLLSILRPLRQELQSDE